MSLSHPKALASNVVSGKVEKIRENKEHLVPGPFTWNNKDRKVRLFLLGVLRESDVGSKEAEGAISLNFAKMLMKISRNFKQILKPNICRKC